MAVAVTFSPDHPSVKSWPLLQHGTSLCSLRLFVSRLVLKEKSQELRKTERTVYVCGHQYCGIHSRKKTVCARLSRLYGCAQVSGNTSVMESEWPFRLFANCFRHIERKVFMIRQPNMQWFNDSRQNIDKRIQTWTILKLRKHVFICETAVHLATHPCLESKAVQSE